MKDFTANNYYNLQFIITTPINTLTIQQKKKLSDVYSAWTGEGPTDIYCDSCLTELYNRLKKEVEKFMQSK